MTDLPRVRETPEYGPAHGVLTPMANTTVEPEFQALLPGTVMAARLVSTSPDSRQRLEDYTDGVDAGIASFDVAPLTAAGFACTCWYLRGHEAEDRAVADLARRHGVPVATSTTAIREVFALLGVRRFAWLVPYPSWLQAEGRAYWTRLGIDITAVVGLPEDLRDTRGIYRLTSARVAEMWTKLDRSGADAVLLGGTGMPSLPLIATTASPVPILSSNLCLAAAMAAGATTGGERAATIRAMIAPDAPWTARFRSPRAA